MAAQAGLGRPGAGSRGVQPRSTLPTCWEALPLPSEEENAFPGEPAEATITSNTQKSDENKTKRKREMENEASENPQLTALDDTDLAFSEGSQSLYKPEPLEKVLNEMNKEIMNLLSKYAHILSERAAMDASYVQELEEILKEARTIENHLKQKKESLKQRLTVIASTLQS